ncbi:MAG: Ig-like domain-containing protein, partial [Prosthecobacter sp.]
MKQNLLSLFYLFLSASTLVAAPIAGWNVSTLPGGAANYGPSPLAATESDLNVTVGGLTRGAGVTTINSGAARGWGGNNWNSTTSAAAITANQFATFSITPNSGYTFSLSSISKFDYRRSGSGAASALVQYQLGAGSFTDITTVSYTVSTSGGASLPAIDLSGISALQNVLSGTTVTFRIVNYGATGATGTWYIFDVANTTATDLQIDGTVTTSGGDMIAPLASSFSPLDGATSVAVNATPAITFNEAVQKGTGNILIKHISDDTTLATIDVTSGQVAVSTNTVTITPTSAFVNATSFYIEIPAGAIKDLAGNNYAGISGNAAWNFTTLAADMTPPTVASFSPLDDATGVANSATPSITFSEPVKKGTGNILIKNSGGIFDTIAVTSTQVVVAGSTVTITPTAAFANSTGYYLEIPAGAIEDIAGNDYAGIGDQTTWNFTTGITQQAYLATNVTSATGAARPTGGFASADHYAEGSALGTFAVYSIANFRFNKVDFLLPGSANIDNIVTAEYTLTTNNRTFAAGTELEFFLTTDQMNGNFTGKVFNTATANGINNANYTFAPVSLGVFPYTPATTPAQGGLPNTFTLNLSAVEPALLAQLNAGAEFSIILAATTPTAAITYSGKGNTFDPGDPSLKFTVNQTPGTDNDVPLVAALTPADGFSGFPLNSNLSIRFNELVQKGVAGTISIFNTTGNALIEAIDVTSTQVTVSNATVTIDPTNPLVSGNTYYVQITAGAIEDVSGNDYAGFADTTTWDFTT